MEIKDQTSRTAVVTGGGSGIGAAVCHHLAAAGHRVAVLDLDREAADACARAIRGAGRDAFATAVDVASRESIDGALDEVRQTLGPIGILVTSAAVSGFAPLEQIDAARWERTIAINLTGTFHSVQAAIGDMVDGGWGRIVTIASAAGQAGSARQTDYAASKGGVIALTKTVALEFASRGVTCNTLAPFAAAAGATGRQPPARRRDRPSDDPRRADGHPRRSRRDLRVSLHGGSGLPHRAGDRGEWRSADVTEPSLTTVQPARCPARADARRRDRCDPTCP
jgi:2-hydroxycyclohexanecarboxyl-CoA dehydrogenase